MRDPHHGFFHPFPEKPWTLSILEKKKKRNPRTKSYGACIYINLYWIWSVSISDSYLYHLVPNMAKEYPIHLFLLDMDTRFPFWNYPCPFLYSINDSVYGYGIPIIDLFTSDVVKKVFEFSNILSSGIGSKFFPPCSLDFYPIISADNQISK